MPGSDDLYKIAESSGSVTDTIKGFVEDGGLKKILPALLAGGGTALAAGAITKRHKKPNGKKEDRKDYTKRLLRNALVAGGLGAAGTAAVQYGLGQFAKESPTPMEGVDNPLEEATKNVTYSPLVGAGAGLATLLGLKGGVDRAAATHADSVIKRIANQASKNKMAVSGTGNIAKYYEAADIADYLAGKKGSPALSGVEGIKVLNRDIKGRANIRKLIADAGLTAEEMALSGLHNPKGGAMSRAFRNLEGLIGRTKGQKTVRGILASSAFMAPSVIQAMLAKREND